MQCEQIRPLIQDYVNGALPGYKGAWVSQHLAWCKECQVLTAKARSHQGAETEVAAAGPERSQRAGRTSGNELRPVLYRQVGPSRGRRRSSHRRGRRLLTMAAALVIGAGALWVWRDPLLRLMTDVSWSEVLVKLGILQ